ncbi:MAG: nucleotide exchange factor GrpE [Bacteroidales bacterium]|nr:nucleotide exchange factor GrpE [Bacteroidales bacterium]
MAKDKKQKASAQTEQAAADEEKIKTEALEADLAKAKEDLEKEKNDYLKLLAEFNTFRQRTKEERASIISSASADTIKGLLPVLDDCERAMELLKASSDEAAKEGTSLIYNKLFAYLKTRGLERIEALGQKFDTDFHEAEAMIPVAEEEKKGMVYDVIQTGYLLDGKVLRFAKVVVGQ